MMQADESSGKRIFPFYESGGRRFESFRARQDSRVSVPDTWVTVYSGDMGNTLVVSLSLKGASEAARSLRRSGGALRERLRYRPQLDAIAGADLGL